MTLLRASFGLGLLVFIVLAVLGWIINLLHVIGNISSDFTTEMIIRLVGIPIPVIGSIMGWFA